MCGLSEGLPLATRNSTDFVYFSGPRPGPAYRIARARRPGRLGESLRRFGRGWRHASWRAGRPQRSEDRTGPPSKPAAQPPNVVRIMGHEDVTTTLGIYTDVPADFVQRVEDALVVDPLSIQVARAPPIDDDGPYEEGRDVLEQGWSG